MQSRVVRRLAVSFLVWLDDVRFIENLRPNTSQNLMHWLNETVKAPLHTEADLKNVVELTARKIEIANQVGNGFGMPANRKR